MNRINKDEYDDDESDEYEPVGALIIQIDGLTPSTISQGGTPTERLTLNFSGGHGRQTSESPKSEVRASTSLAQVIEL